MSAFILKADALPAIADIRRPKSLKPPGVAYTKSGKSGPVHKRAIVALVERDGSARAFHAAHADEVVITIVTDNIAKESRLHTDEGRPYFGTSEHFAAHETIRNSSGEYVRGDVHSNATDGYFGNYKRRKGECISIAAKSIYAQVSALGQKETFALQYVMSAIPPKADRLNCTVTAEPRAQFKIEPVSASRLRKTGIFQILARDFRQEFQTLRRNRARQRLGKTEKAPDVRAFSRFFGTNLTRAELGAGVA